MGVEDRDRGLGQMFPVHPHSTFVFSLIMSPHGWSEYIEILWSNSVLLG